jgi:hypothetical protein
MQIKINGIKITLYRKKDHKQAIWEHIYRLRNEIVDDVLEGSRDGRMPVKKLKHKAELILKYSKRLRLLEL